MVHTGEYVQSSNKNITSGCIKFLLVNKVPKIRNLADIIKHAETAIKKNKPVFGVESKSSLLDLMKFYLILGCVVDSMQLICRIAQKFAKISFGTKEKVGLLSRRIIPEINCTSK